MVCGENQEYKLETKCPLTCINQVDYDCGEKKGIEGCFCKDGFVMDNKGNCVTVDQCGCELPDKSLTLNVSIILLNSQVIFII